MNLRTTIILAAITLVFGSPVDVGAHHQHDGLIHDDEIIWGRRAENDHIAADGSEWGRREEDDIHEWGKRAEDGFITVDSDMQRANRMRDETTDGQDWIRRLTPDEPALDVHEWQRTKRLQHVNREPTTNSQDWQRKRAASGIDDK
uniref:Uncharacterized protein n=1 Tax=Moniliophthora roreri TaxID=221103 RepID=A0A0W0EZQ5_MONRR